MFFLGQDTWSDEEKRKLNDVGITIFWDAYHPYHGGTNPDFNDFSREILNLKDGNAKAIEHFANYFVNTLRIVGGVVICAVPSHDPQKKQSGVHLVINEISRMSHSINGGHILVRNKKVDKAATGGTRSRQIHLNSIIVSDPAFIKDKNVLLLDDVSTTGCSITACREILLSGGAKAVKLFPFSKTS